MGIEVFIHEEYPEPGRLVSSKIQDAIEAADALVVLITDNSTSSAYVNQEIGWALKAKKPVIPLVAAGVSGADIGMLQGIEFIPFHPDQPSEVLTSLTRSLHQVETRLAALETAETVQRQREKQQELMRVLLALGLAVAVLYIGYQLGKNATPPVFGPSPIG